MPSNVVDYGTPEQPKLDAISRVAQSALNRYHIALPGLTFQENFMLQHTPEKTTTARAVVDTLYDGTKVGDLYIILFAPGDGTGKEGDYKWVRSDENQTYSLQSEETGREGTEIYEIAVPDQYRVPKREGVIPRNKRDEGVLLEACFPLATVEGRHSFAHLVSLEQITFGENRECLTKGLQIGGEDYFNAVLESPWNYQSPSFHKLPIFLTCGYRRDGQRFGDPHATFYNPKLAEGHPNIMQLAAFLAVKNPDETFFRVGAPGNPLCKVLDRIAIVPE